MLYYQVGILALNIVGHPISINEDRFVTDDEINEIRLVSDDESYREEVSDLFIYILFILLKKKTCKILDSSSTTTTTST